jgi:hypothetical protein
MMLGGAYDYATSNQSDEFGASGLNNCLWDYGEPEMSHTNRCRNRESWPIDKEKPRPGPSARIFCGRRTIMTNPRFSGPR